MLIVKGHYSDKSVQDNFIVALNNFFDLEAAEPIVLGIGSERHILDCLGPLAGTMLTEKAPGLLVYGTLDDPLNARNLNNRVELIKKKHPDSIIIALDASLGSTDDLGMIKLFHGPLQPGKALARKLVAVGNLSVTGIVASQSDKFKLDRNNFGNLTLVYHMAKVISDAISSWYNCRSW
jgi:putative sporulation protein YyaC